MIYKDGALVATEELQMLALHWSTHYTYFMRLGFVIRPENLELRD